jgi:D-alanyl-D-alanine dipeptidase
MGTLDHEQLGEKLREKSIPEVGDALLNSFGRRDWKAIPVAETVTETPKPLQVVPNTPSVGHAMAWPAYYKTVSEENTGNGVPTGFGELAENIPNQLQTSPLVKVRPEVVLMLDRGQQILDSSPETAHLQLVVVDGYRTIEVQRRLFEEYRAYLVKENPGMSDEKLDNLAQQMVSMPPENLEKLRICPPPHSTGGAVDVILVEKSKIDITSDYWVKGAMINFGAYFDEMMHPVYKDVRSFTRFDEKVPEDVEARKNRRLLYNLMVSVGFTNYPFEFWHYDSGNQFYALVKGLNIAKFGFAGGLENGKIVEDLRAEEMAFRAYQTIQGLTSEAAERIRHHFGL